MKFDSNNIQALEVYLDNRKVGIINRLAGDMHIFSFEKEYIADSGRPTLSLSFKGQTGGLVTSMRAIARKVPPFFSNLLPEGHLRTYLAKDAGIHEEREFPLLAAFGSDLPGAVVIKPIGVDSVLENNLAKEQNHFDKERDASLKFSLAGVQLKFSAIMEASGGLTIPVNGIGGSWIVKFPSMRFPSVPENEFVMLNLARRVGIQVPEVRLVSIKDIQGLPKDVGNMKENALAIKRFDRAGGNRRIHMEDFAQVFGLFPEDKYRKQSYANIASVLWAETGDVSTHEFIRRLVFSVMIGNADMHLKNWSLLYPDGRKPVLSPAYDLVSTIPYIPSDKLALSFGKSRSLDNITKDQVRRFVDTAGLPMSTTWNIINETMANTIDGWSMMDEKNLLSNALKRSIQKQIQSVRIH